MSLFSSELSFILTCVGGQCSKLLPIRTIEIVKYFVGTVTLTRIGPQYQQLFLENNDNL